MESYDHHFIDNEIIAKAEAHHSEVKHLLNSLRNRATVATLSETAREQPERKPRTTQFAPFNIVQVKPRRTPSPKELPAQFKMRPMNYEIFKYSLSAIERKKSKRRAEERDKVRGKYQHDKDPLKRLFAS